MEIKFICKTSGTTYQMMKCHIPEEEKSKIHCCENIKTHKKKC